MEGFFLVTTDHLEDGLWFRDEEDFKAGMNFVAVQVYESNVHILSFILMSNHLHFVLLCEREEVKPFVNGLKQRFSKYLANKYGFIRHLRRNNTDIRAVTTEDEGLEKAIAYVQMNSVAANICIHPGQYPWGTGNVFFRRDPLPGRALSSFSKRERARLLHSWSDALPGHLTVSNGYILPDTYVQKGFTEDLFRSPKRMQFFLTTSSKARKRIETPQEHLPVFRDQIILAAIPDLCQSLFRETAYKDLSEAQQSELLRQLRFRFCANVNQLARVVGITYAETAALLDRS